MRLLVLIVALAASAAAQMLDPSCQVTLQYAGTGTESVQRVDYCMAQNVLALQQKASDLESKLSDLESDNGELKKKVEDLEDQTNALKSDMPSDQSSEIDDLNTAVSDLKSSVADLESRSNDMAVAVGVLQFEVKPPARTHARKVATPKKPTKLVKQQ
jgi:uncharacterized protein YoxC